MTKIELDGRMSYSFSSPYVTIFVEEVSNNNEIFSSGEIKIILVNVRYAYDGSIAQSKAIAEFCLDPLPSMTCYRRVNRTVRINQNVSFPDFCIIACEDCYSGWELCSIQRFPRKRSSYVEPPPPPPTRPNFRITKKPSESLLKKGVRTAANIASAAGTVAAVAGIVCPPLTIIGAIGGFISSFLQD